MKSKCLGQITVRKVGKKYLVCLSGTPEFLFTSFDKATSKANNLRKKHGRRIKK
jgi:hypothetical protein